MTEHRNKRRKAPPVGTDRGILEPPGGHGRKRPYSVKYVQHLVSAAEDDATARGHLFNPVGVVDDVVATASRPAAAVRLDLDDRFWPRDLTRNAGPHYRPMTAPSKG